MPKGISSDKRSASSLFRFTTRVEGCQVMNSSPYPIGGDALLDVTRRATSDVVLRFFITVSRGLIEIPDWSSKDVTTLGTAKESSIPLVIRGLCRSTARGLPACHWFHSESCRNWTESGL